jgi:DNA (cytosine-5)-methyltransferase 1
MQMKSLDLFCGCGGISEGLRLAGFEAIAGVDIEQKYLATFAHNFQSARSIAGNLSEIAPHGFMQSLNLKPGQLDILAGGPPCQGFSKNVPRKHRFLDSPNNRLIKTFLDYCEAIKPKMILMENVAEMHNGFDRSYTAEIIERLEEEGYTVTEAVLNAADYGVPQRRRRTFFMANRFGFKFRIPEPTHCGDGPADLLAKPRHVRVWEAIGDLPSVGNGQGREICPYSSDPFSPYQSTMRDDRGIVRNHIARKLSPIQHARLAALQPGQGLKDLPPHLQVKSGYSGAYGRLTKEMVAPTITRWVFHPGSGRWGHPVDTRVLTIREAARIQGFPDTFEFVGTYTDQAGQIGNAVPPALVTKIAASMMIQLGSHPSFDSNATRASKGRRSASEGKANVVLCGESEDGHHTFSP